MVSSKSTKQVTATRILILKITSYERINSGRKKIVLKTYTTFFLFLIWQSIFLFPAHASAPHPFLVRGIGAAGGLFVPSVSPYDTNLMLVASDMGGTYRSENGGNSWELIHFTQIRDNKASAYPAYFSDKIFWNTGNRLCVSHDKGKSWQKVPTRPWGKKGKIRYLSAMPGNPDTLLVSASNGLWITDDSGETWKKTIKDWTIEPVVLGDSIYTFSGRNTFNVSHDRGLSWQQLTFPWMGQNTVFSLTGGMENMQTVLFASIYKIGIIKSIDRGKSWDIVVDKFENQDNLQMAMNQTRVIYAFQNHGKKWCKTAWRSTDSGNSWDKCFRLDGWNGNVKTSWVQKKLKWGYYITKNGFYASKTHHSLAILSTQGELYITRNGAKSWRHAVNKPIGNSTYKSTGLDNTTCWKYLVSPWEQNRHYIAYSDIGLASSMDGGASWANTTKGSPWKNTFYDIIFDPEIKGRMYAAVSNRHDIPHWTHITENSLPNHSGGVVISNDHGETWKALGKGLPNKPATSIIIDPESSGQNRSLYAAVFGEGVYKSTNDGNTWNKSSNGLGNPGNMHVLKLKQHPKSGNLYCLITANRKKNKFTTPGGLWKSVDAGKTWRNLTLAKNFLWPTDFFLVLEDEAIIYLSVATSPKSNQGGIWKTTDGGKKWQSILKDSTLKNEAGGASYDHMMSITRHPTQHNILYAGTTLHGLWYSKDSGAEWHHFKAFPHRTVHSIDFNPQTPGQVFITTFGAGAWSGSYLPAQ